VKKKVISEIEDLISGADLSN